MSDQMTAKGSEEGFVQDQIILAPEIMRLILAQCDFPSLKRVRLVCKSWLREANSHMERRGIIWLHTDTRSTRISDFIKVTRNKVPGLPQPFSSIDVGYRSWTQSFPCRLPLRQLSKLCPPLLMTRLSTEGLPLGRAIPIISQCSSSLEYLKLCVQDYGGEKTQREEDNLESSFERNRAITKLPKLRHVQVDCSAQERINFWHDVISTADWVSKRSPNIEKFEIWGNDDDWGDDDEDMSDEQEEGNFVDVASEILRSVDIRNVKSLVLGNISAFDDAKTLEHISSISFSQLQDLRLSFPPQDYFSLSHEGTIAIVTTAAETLRKLDLLDIDEEDLPYLTGSSFPPCPNVQELSLRLFPGWNKFFLRCFPSLQAFNTHYLVEPAAENKNIFDKASPLLDVNTLTLPDVVYSPEIFGPMELLTTFPALERLHIHDSFLFKYLRMMGKSGGGGGPQFSDLLRGLKHLELDGRDRYQLLGSDDAGYSLLPQLKGIESISFKRSNALMARLPLKEMKSLKIIRFVWGDYLDMKKLLEISRGVEKVILTNCCSFPRGGSRRASYLLRKFFDSAANAECGCRYEEIMEKL